MDEILNLIESVSEGFPSYSFMEMLSLIALDDKSDMATRLRSANTLWYILGLSRSFDTEIWEYYMIKFKI